MVLVIWTSQVRVAPQNRLKLIRNSNNRKNRNNLLQNPSFNINPLAAQWVVANLILRNKMKELRL